MNLKLGKILQVSTVRGEPLQVGGRQLVPIARTFSLTVHWPGAPLAGTFTRTRPIAVEVVDDTGSRRIPIPSARRKMMFALMAAAALSALLRILVGRWRSQL